MRPVHFLVVLASLALAPGLTNSFAQPAPASQQDERKMSKEERMWSGLRDAMGVTDDEEWKILMPKIARAQVLAKWSRDLHDTRKSMGRLKSLHGINPNDPPPYYLQDLADRARELRAAWEDKDTHPNQIQRDLKAFREARDKAEKELSEELSKARDELRDLVTARQELALIMAGILD
jgi:hypothetical protein